MALQNNKFARQAEISSKKNKGEEKITLDARLARLEEDVRRLKIEYDTFFNGGSKRAPFETRNRVETAVKRLSDERSFTFAQRYQYNSIVARYTAFKELWRRTIQEREEGRDAATLARAALAKQEEANSAAEERETGKIETNRSVVFSCADVAQETVTVQKIYDALVAAKRRCGETTDGLSFAQFERMLAAQTENFKQKTGCREVSFEIAVENGRAVFKAKAEAGEQNAAPPPAN